MENPDSQDKREATQTNVSRDAEAWAPPVTRLSVNEVPDGARNLNVDGRLLSGPMEGFGQLWRRTYRTLIPATSEQSITPAQVAALWKQKLPDLMPTNNHFYPSLSGVKPGELVLINASMPIIPGGMPVATGVLVLYADNVSFTVITPEGHPESGFNTFSAFEENGHVYAQVESLARTTDLIYEIGYSLFNYAKTHDAIWCAVLTNLAAQFGAPGKVDITKELVDSKRQWSRIGNIWQNAVIRTVIYSLLGPLRWLRQLFETA
ncbi:MAG: DUF1990 family protein [Anaerolineaceae bacterium]|nr:DUF1990 family protein [Anaerolineaceae bacterium]